MTKTLDDHFVSWESTAFGYGYGTGEEHILPALKAVLAAIPESGCYDYEALEAAVTPTVAWLILNVLCNQDAVEYGTSPRHGWLSPAGKRLKAYVDANEAAHLIEIACQISETNPPCYPNACNCGPKGYVAEAVCPNPFWERRP